MRFWRIFWELFEENIVYACVFRGKEVKFFGYPTKGVKNVGYYVVNGVRYSGTFGDGPKETAKDLYAKGEHIDPYRSNVDELHRREIQRELEKLKYTNGR